MNDARFLAITPGGILRTLTDTRLEVQLSVPAGSSDFQLGIFDGDVDGAHWDVGELGPGELVSYTVFADKNNDSILPGNPDDSDDIVVASFTDADMADNAWVDFTLGNVPEAKSSSGNFIYRLVVELVTDPGRTAAVRLALKVRVSDSAFIEVFQQPFSFIAAMQSCEDFNAVYPNLNIDCDTLTIPFPPDLSGSTYDGTFSFFINLTVPQRKLVIWDGDLDRGSVNDTTCLGPTPGPSCDADDANSLATPDDDLEDGFSTAGVTPNAEGIPVVTRTTCRGFPGGHTGCPPDDVGVPGPSFSFTDFFVRTPSITYDIYKLDDDFPSVRTLIATNSNPSGNEEWEKFRIDSTSFPPAVDPAGPPDKTLPAIPAGTYEVRVKGVDIENLNAFFFTRLLCVNQFGRPCDQPPAPYLVGDLFFFDPNGNGVPEAGEPGIPGVIVNLRDTDQLELLASTVTDADGLYSFEVEAGAYTVEVAPENFTAPVPGGALGDRVWLDLGADGIDAGEPGLGGVAVQLFDAGGDGLPGGGDDTLLDSAITDPGGRYLFSNLPPGSYYTSVVAASVPAGLVLTGGASPSAIRTILATEVFLDLDFGYAPAAGTAAVGDRVWHDLDGDGLQDAGEPGIDGVTLALVDTGSSLTVATTTTAGGRYLFAGVAPGSYSVDVTDTAGVLSGYALTTANDPTAPFALAAGDLLLDKDFGYVQGGLLSIVDRVWFDANRNGLLDGGETGIGGVTVTLAGPGDQPLATTTTAADGSFSFHGLPSGQYTLVITDLSALLNGLLPTTQGAVDGAHDVSLETTSVSGIHFGYVDTSALAGSLATTASPTQANVVVDANVLTYDFGYRFASAGDRIWLDLNGNGVQDPGEPGISGVTVRLFDSGGGLVATTVTGTDGIYGFDRLPAGGYTVAVDPSTLPAGLAQTFDLDGLATPDAATFPLAAGQDRDDVDFGYRVVCGLTVDKTCQVVPEPEPFDCSDAKPLDLVAMVWDGTQVVDVRAWKGAVGSTLLATVTGVAPGQEVAVSGYAGSPNDVFWQILATGTNHELGRSKFHLSCSDSEMNGPEDCGKRQGNGKSDETGLINDWRLDGLGGNGLTLDCTPTPPAAADACEVIGQPAPSCDSLGNPDTLTFSFTGGGCAASDNDQPADKAFCSETSPGIDGAQPVTVTDDDGALHFLDPGESFTIPRDHAKVLTLSQLGREETNEIHVSCSQPLAAGDVYGSLTLSAFDGQEGGVEVIYSYSVSNLGAPLSGVTLADDKLGAVGGPIDLPAGGAATFTASTRLSDTTTNRVDASGFAVLGVQCLADDEVTVTVTEPCFECDGGTVDLTFRYLGTAPAQLVIYDDKDAKADEVLFSGTVNPNDTIQVTPRPGQSRLDNNISLWLDGELDVVVHTSCSQPIGPGLITGEFEIVEARSKNNGLICPLDVCDPQGTAAFEFNGRELKWDLTNLGDAHLVIERISVSWPAANGALTEIKRDGDTIHKGDFAPTSAVIDSGWEGNPDKRRIKVGETDTLKLKFDNDAAGGDYAVTVEFDQGCSISLSSSTPPGGGGTFECSKPIDALSMVWDGSQAAKIKAWKGSVGSTLLATIDNISVGQEVTVSGFAGSPNDVIWQVFAAGGSSPLGSSKFHLSCSDNEMDGAEDCGKRQGNGKSNESGLINDWLLEGMVGSKGPLDCTP